MARKRKAGDGTVRQRKDGRWEGRIVISALAQHLLTMLKFALEAETNRNPLFS